MQVATYHIHNVLRAYTRQLGLGKRTVGNNNVTEPNRTDNISISAKARRKAVVEKVTADIVERIVRNGPQEGLEQEVFKQLEDEFGNNLALEEDSSDLAFKVVDKEKGEEIHTLSIEDSKVLKHRLEQITRSKVDADMLE
jgi:hypothetical protein